MVSPEERQLSAVRRELLGWAARLDRLRKNPPGTWLALTTGDRPLTSLDFDEVEAFCSVALFQWQHLIRQYYKDQHDRIRRLNEGD